MWAAAKSSDAEARAQPLTPTCNASALLLYCSGASVYMPDFEDSNCPTWSNLVQGQVGVVGE